MNGGIDQLVNTYKGNPQPLAQKVQDAQQQVQQQTQQQLQQGQPPGAIPPDLEEAIALQKISEMRQGAQNQQAMQAGGAQPSVVEKLRQMLGNMQQQGQPQMGQMPQQMPQGQPVMAAHGGSIDQLMSNLGRHYAGGGIVAFKTGGKGEDPDAADSEYSDEPLGMGSLPQRPNPLAALARLVSQAVAREKKPSMMLEPSEAPDITPTEVVKPEQTPAPAPAPVPEVNKLPPAPPRPPAANINAPAPAKPAVETVDPMETIIRNSIMKTMGQDPDEVRRKAIEANKQAMGLDALLKPAQDRAAAREAMTKQIQEERTPEWVKGLQRAGRARPGSGVGALLGELGAGTSEARETYSAENLRFLDELNKLHEGIDKAKIEGRYKDVAAGETAIKDLISSQRQAETSGTSLLNTAAVNKTREQVARDAAAGRAQSASQHNAQMALQLEEKKRQFNEELLRKMREKDVDRYNKIETAIAKRTGMIDMQLQNPKLKPEEETALLARRNTIVEQVKAEYPPIKPEKPTESQFLAVARAANPGVSDADLKAYYKQNYGS